MQPTTQTRVNTNQAASVFPAPDFARLAPAAALLGVLGGMVTATALAQEAPRYSIAGEAAALAKRKALEEAPYSFQYGQLKAQLETGINFEFNDNVNLADLGRQQDLIVRPQVNIRSFFPVTQLNSLNFSIGVAPALYVQHSEYNRVLITPGSELAMDLFVGDYLVNVHEQFSYTQDPISIGSISGSAVYGGFNNTAGIKLVGDYNDLILSVGYDHGTFLSSTKQFEQLNNSSENFNAHATFQVTRAFSLGLTAGGGFNHYDQNFLNDHRSYSVGADSVLAVSPRLTLSLNAGAVFYDFDQTGTVGPTPNQQSYYAGAAAEHKLNQDMSHSLRLSRELQLGVSSDVVEVWSVRYQADLQLLERTYFTPKFFYEHGRELKSVGGEDYDRFGAGVGVTRQLSEKLRAGVGYIFTLKDSDLALRSYRQNSLTLDVTYRF
ncbi:MAG: hypothetical protein EBS05_04770 [Proteobacteria bacterium]|nr:hypothetical protein [Pseudomonadota bacterium]